MSEATILISAGSGPKECEFAARGIAKAYAREARAAGLSVLELESEHPGSYLLRLTGEFLDIFLRTRCGTVKWIGRLPPTRSRSDTGT